MKLNSFKVPRSCANAANAKSVSSSNEKKLRERFHKMCVSYANKIPMTVEELRSRAIRCVEGKKDDQGKLPYELLPFSVIDGIVAVQRFGAAKYGQNNWQRVKNGKKRYIAAALRHISRIQQGERQDPESKMSHIYHALCSLMYAAWIDERHLKRHGRYVQP